LPSFAESLFGEAVGGDVGRHGLSFRDAEDVKERVVNLFDLAARVRRPPAEQLDAAVDDAAGVGDIINGCVELLGWSPTEARRKVEAIYDTLLNVFRIARAEAVPPHVAADRLAEERLNAA